MIKSLLSALAFSFLTIPAIAQSISGTVFEDVNYGGGAGRPLATAQTSATNSGYTGSLGRPGVIVELYLISSGAFVNSAVTNAAGLYTFTGLTANTGYTVRVVNSSVTSGRTGATYGGTATAGYYSNQLAVQTFRTSGGVADANRVGGENPAVTDGASNVAGGSNVALAFQGLNTFGDNTQYVDNVQVLQGGTALATNPIQNPGFESGVLVPTNGSQYQYNPTPAATFGWTFSGESGIQANGSAFGSPITTNGTGADGTRASFIQRGGNVSQTFSLPAGTYSIRFAAANRQYGSTQSVNVTVNGTTVLANVTAATSGYAVYTTNTFTVAAGGANFSTLTAQSVGAVTTGAVASTVAGENFGFNFDVVTNTSDAGQGSLRQFIFNANTLGNANITQAGNYRNTAGANTALPTGVESSIFMIPNGANPTSAGLRTGLASGLNGGSGANTWAFLTLTTPLPALTDASTALDATTQTVNVSDSNPGQVGLGGASGRFPTVGTQAMTYGTFNRPEVEVYCLTSAYVVTVLANTSTVRGFALHGGGGTGTLQVSGVTGALIESNFIGTAALSIDDPTLTVANSASNYCINLNGTLLGVTVNRNVIAYANNSGIYVPSGGTQSGSSIVIQGNELVQNGYRVTGGDNITVGDQGATGPVTISGNLVRTANSDGLQFEIGNIAQGGVGYNTVENNTFFDNGNGGASVARAQLEGAAILYIQRSASINAGTNADIIRYNIINQTQAGAVVVGYGQSGINISQNSTFFNGTPFNSPTAGNLGIDLITQASYYVGSSNPTGARDYGNGDGVTPNAGTVASGPANQGMNYPVFTVATATGQTSNLVNVAGYVGSATGQTQFANARVEIFTADNVPANNNGNIVSGDGQTQPHGEGRTYITTLTCDANGNFSGLITVPANSPPLSGTAVTGFLTATAYLAAYGTSEFGPNRPIIVSADVQAVITGSGTTTAGQTGQFTANFSNPAITGPVQADGVIATVQTRAGLTNVNVSVNVGGSVSSGTYNATTGLVSFGLPAAGISLPSGFTATATITYTQPALGPVTATAAITTTTNEAGQTANNTSTATNPTMLVYDLTTAIAGPATVTAGNQVAYVVTTTNVQNTGAGYISPASSVTQSVTVPVGATNLYVTGNGVITGSSGAGYTVTWPALPSLNNGQSVSQTVSFTAPATSYGLTATVGSTPADAVSTNNTQTFNTTTSASSGSQANVFARISAGSATVAPGTTGSFSVTQGNAGPNAAANARSLVVLPPGLASVVATGPSGTIAGAYNATTGLVTLPTTTSQASGTANNLSYTISFTAPAAGGVVPATVQVLTTSPDQVPADNEASALVTVAAAADVVVQVTGPTIGTVGQPLTYTVTTSNNGPGSALNMVQTANLPAGLPITGTSALLLNGNAPTSVSGSTATYGSGATAFTYDQTTGLVTFPTTASLPTGTSVQNTFSLLTPPNGNLPITVSSAAVASSPDSNTANNGNSLTTNVTPTTDVQVTLSSAGQISPGNRLTYGVTTFNNGPATAPGVATTVSLPTGLTTVVINGLTGTLTGGVYTYADGSIYDPRTTGSTPGLATLPALTNLAPGNASGVVNTIGYILPSGFQGTLTSTATTTVTGIADFIPSNNTAIVQPFIVANSGTSDLQVTLTAGVATVAAGSPLTLNYTASTAAAITGFLQSVLLPSGLTSNGGTITVTDGGGAAVGVNYDNQSGLLTLPPYLNVTGGGSVSYQIAISQVPGTGPLVATATINSNELDSNPANNVVRLPITITPAATLQATVSGPASVLAGSTVSYLISALNTGRTPTTGATQTVNVPTGATNLVLNGQAIAYPAGGVLSLPIPSTLLPGIGNTVVNTLSFTAPGSAGTSFQVPTTLAATGPGTVGNATASQTTVLTNPGPVAQNVVHVALTATSTQVPLANNVVAPQPIQSLVAAAQGTASLTSYTVQTLPLASQGVLYLWNGSTNSAVTAGQPLTSTQAGQLRFQPAAGYSGNATFLYSATDNAGAVSNVAQYLIPVAPDLNSAYAATPTKGGASAYQNDDVLTYVIDPNGARYTSGAPGLVYGTSGGTRSTLLQSGAANGLPTTGTNAVLASTGSGPAASSPYPANMANSLPAGTTLDPITGYVYVSDRTLLPKVTTATYYQVNVITTDVYGGTNTITSKFVLGAYPLPVELVAFTAQAVQNRDGLLKWTTALEVNNDHFDVERSLDGTTYGTIGQRQGQGHNASATDYNFTDAGVANKLIPGQLVYYRLRQVDANGTSTYSPVRVIAFTAAPALLLTPNPATTTPTLTLIQAPASTYTVTLLDALGRSVLTLALMPGRPQLLPVQGLATGTYLVVVTSEIGLRLTKRLLLQ